MNKCIILSIEPKWAKKILNSEKTIEIGKVLTMPKCKSPIDVYIYCTKTKSYLMVGKKKNKTYLGKCSKDSVYSPNHNYIGNGKIVAKFTLNKIDKITKETEKNITKKCLIIKQRSNHVSGNNYPYNWHIDNFEIFDEPMELKDFKVSCKDYHNGWSGCDDYCGYAENHECFGGKHILHQAPQSWCYAYKD